MDMKERMSKMKMRVKLMILIINFGEPQYGVTLDPNYILASSCDVANLDSCFYQDRPFASYLPNCRVTYIHIHTI